MSARPDSPDARGLAAAGPGLGRAWIWFCRTLCVVAVLGGWEAAVRTGYLHPDVFARPMQVASLTADWLVTGYIGEHVLTTVVEAALGYAFGVLLGVSLAAAFAFTRVLDELLSPFVAALNAIPKIVLAPLFVLWFGLDMKPKIVMAAVLVCFIVFFNVYSGIKQVDRNLVNNVRIMGASRYRLLTELYLPATFVWLMASLRASIGFAFIGALVGEYVGANRGLGFVIASANTTNDMTIVFAGLLVVMVLVGTVDMLLSRVERTFAAWTLS